MSSWRDDSDRVTTGMRRYSGGATRCSKALPALSQLGLEHHVPHVAVHVVDPGDLGAGGPQRRQERARRSRSRPARRAARGLR